MNKRRINLILILIFTFGAIIIGRLIHIQVIKHNDYLAFASGQHNLSEAVEPNRGDIFVQDKKDNLYLLATNRDSKFVFVSPNQIKNKEEIISNLSEILNIDEKEIRGKVDQKENLYSLIKKKLTGEEIEKLQNLEIEGIHLGTETYRYYPEEETASHILGFVGGENLGQYGIEGFYQEELKGRAGLVVGEKSRQGYMVYFDSQKSLPAEEGSNLILGVDFYIQFKAEELLKEVSGSLGVEDGQIVVMDPNSGRIIAAASLSNFNPNNYFDYDLETFMDSFSQKVFEPGSVFKPITLAIAIEEGKITPQTTYVDEGFVKIGPDTVFNYAKRVYGKVSMTEVLEKSINTGAVFAVQQISHKTFLDYVEKFGIFEKTFIDLQGEVCSANEGLKEGYEMNFATAAFGQGISMTPVQLMRAFSVFANGGKLVKPYFVQRIKKADGTILETQPEIQNPQVISQNTASKLTAMLVSVVENGFGNKAKIPGYYIAGKTGTAQVPEGGKYSSDRTIQTFIGFAPAFNPKFLILVKLDNPQAKTAEYSAVPVFQKLAKYVIDYYQIPPDYEE